MLLVTSGSGNLFSAPSLIYIYLRTFDKYYEHKLVVWWRNRNVCLCIFSLACIGVGDEVKLHNKLIWFKRSACSIMTCSWLIFKRRIGDTTRFPGVGLGLIVTVSSFLATPAARYCSDTTCRNHFIDIHSLCNRHLHTTRHALPIGIVQKNIECIYVHKKPQQLPATLERPPSPLSLLWLGHSCCEYFCEHVHSSPTQFYILPSEIQCTSLVIVINNNACLSKIFLGLENCSLELMCIVCLWWEREWTFHFHTTFILPWQ